MSVGTFTVKNCIQYTNVSKINKYIYYRIKNGNQL